jgi:hypothetical protein
VNGSHEYIQRALVQQHFNNPDEFLVAACQIEMVEKRINTRREEQARAQAVMLVNENQETEKHHFLKLIDNLRESVSELAIQVKEVRDEIKFSDQRAKEVDRYQRDRNASIPRAPARFQDSVTCNFCGRRGHFSRECRERFANERTRSAARGSNSRRSPHTSKK